MSATPRPKPGSVAIIGSGFGGSVSALRLAEQGWDVTVLEQGRRLTDADLLAARTDLRAYLRGPGTTGFFWQRVFRHMGIIGANAVGGGSIVWAAVLLEPKPKFFQDTQWPRGTDWQQALKDHYATAARMLGLTVTPESALGLQDAYLEKTAAAMGAHDTFGRVPSAIYYGDGPGITHADPFFGGDGPERTGCRLCGGCLTGCPYGAKNTLDRNYLHLAERAGARIVPDTRVDAIVPLPHGGYALKTQGGTTHTAERVVVSAGVLGTMELLLRCRDELGTLPHLSPMLGEKVRTNSEAITGVLQPPGGPPLTRGPSISTDVHPDAQTHITQNRYVGGGRILRLSLGPLTDGDDPKKRTRETLKQIAKDPVAQLKIVFAKDFEARYTALSVMQSGDGVLGLRLRRSPARPWKRVLRSAKTSGPTAPSYIKQANDATREFARVSGGTPLNMTVESIAGRSFTAHIPRWRGDGGGRDTRRGRREPRGLRPPRPLRGGRERDPRGRRREPVADDHRNERALRHALRTTDKTAGTRDAHGAPDLPPEAREALVGPVTPGPRGRLARELRRPGAPPADRSAGRREAGLPGWLGKRFDAHGRGTNLIHGGRETHHEMTAHNAASAIDGRDVLLVSYDPQAPLPWRHVRDELRALPDGRLLGMSAIKTPGLNRGLPFVLTKVR